MKKRIRIKYIPIRYILSLIIALLEILTMLGIVFWLCAYFPVFYLIAFITQFICVVQIAASDDNPDYKVPWLLCVVILPIVGFMLYFLFYSRKLKPKFIRRLAYLTNNSYRKDDSAQLDAISEKDSYALAQAKMLCNIADTHVFTDTELTYFESGEKMHASMLSDLEKAEKFIFMEYFIIEQGEFWNSILEILAKKAAEGVLVRVVYDDIGCMMTLPGNYAKKLRKLGINCVPFSRLRGSADSEFNNRSHRKITVIDGKIGYTGGVNLADEYINKKVRFGHWKDTGIRLEGEAVHELTKLFIIDYGINVRRLPDLYKIERYPESDTKADGYVIPFGDGPLCKRRVGKSVIKNMLAHSTDYMYMMTPYLIIDNSLCQSIENAAMRGTDVRIILPQIPDKKLIFAMTRTFYPRLMSAGVKIYEYAPGFVHAKNYLADDKFAMVGTINLDYRSLVHHFENGVWMYDCPCIEDIKKDFENTLEKCTLVTPDMIKSSRLRKFLCSIVRIFSPLL